MERSAIRTFITLLLSVHFLAAHAGEDYDREEIKPRLVTMDCIVKPRYTSSVESYIKGYFGNDASKAKMVLARSVTYFPIFEKYLAKYNMPDDLKYLAVVESALNPKAVSRVGATGLWQFMEETGASYGLEISSRIDERSCPNRSTIAALEYLTKAYDRFGSWELAIASYNCGAGNVRKAIRRSGGSKNYWRISRYLPRETRNFIPAFLGAAYMVKFFHLHAVEPEYRNLDLQLTESLLVYNEMSFTTIAALAGLPQEVVQQLNPAYKDGFVPASVEGHWVVLPRRTMQALKDYIKILRPDSGSASAAPPLPELTAQEDYLPYNYYHKTLYSVLEGDSLSALGLIFNCAAYNLKVWNGLVSDSLETGQELVVWFPKETKRYRPFNQAVEVLPVEVKAPVPGQETDRQGAKPKIKAIVPISTAAIANDAPANLPFNAMSVARAEQKLVREQQEKERAKTRKGKWFNKKLFFKKRKKR